MTFFAMPSAADIAAQIASVPPNTPWGTYQISDTLGASSASDGSAGNVVSRVFSLVNAAGVSGTITDAYSYGVNAGINNNPTAIVRGAFAVAAGVATAFTTALSTVTATEGVPITMTVTPSGAWPGSTTLTPSATTVTGTWSPTTSTPSRTAPAVFTFTSSNIAAGTLNVSASPSMTNTSGAQSFAATAAPPAGAFTLALSSSTEVISTGVVITATPTSGAWPSGTSLTPFASGLTGTWAPTTATPSGTTPQTFTFTPSAAGTGTLSVSTSTSMTNTTGVLANTVTSTPVASTISSAAIDSTGTTLTLTFNQAVTLTAADISFTVAGSARTASNSDAGTSGTTHVFTLSSTAYSGQAATYTTSSTAFTSPALAATASGVSVTNNSTVSAPVSTTITSAVVATDGVTTTLTFSQAVTLTVADITFAIAGGVVTATNTDHATSSTTHVFTISTAFSGQVVAYTTSSTAFTSPALAATASGVSVTNNSTQSLPSLPAHYLNTSASGTGTAGYNHGMIAPTTSFTVQAQIATPTYNSPNAIGEVFSQWGSTGAGFILFLSTTGCIGLVFQNGAFINITSTVPISLPTNTPVWIRAVATTGSVTFGTSLDGSTWTNLGTPVTVPGDATWTTNNPTTVGNAATNSPPANFLVMKAQAICDGVTAWLADFTILETGATSFVEPSTGQTVTINAPATVN